jgi:hypothetical protein
MQDCLDAYSGHGSSCPALRSLHEGREGTPSAAARRGATVRVIMRALALRKLAKGVSALLVSATIPLTPQGRACWAVRLVGQEAVKRKLVPRVGRVAQP